MKDKATTQAKTAPETPAQSEPRRWMVVQASAPLQTVAATNYVCYGGAKVPHYGGAEPAPPPREAGVLCAELFVRGPDEALRLAELDVQFRVWQQTEQHVIWQWMDRDRWLQVVWVWDFFRLLSHTVLRAGIPPDQEQRTEHDLVSAVRAIAPDDTLILKVQSPCGNILQRHRLPAAAGEWAPEKAEQ